VPVNVILDVNSSAFRIQKNILTNYRFVILSCDFKSETAVLFYLLDACNLIKNIFLINIVV
jgi:hypothetical protein